MLIFPNDISGIISPAKFMYQLYFGIVIVIWHKRKLSENGDIIMEQSVVIQEAFTTYSIHCLEEKKKKKLCLISFFSF